MENNTEVTKEVQEQPFEHPVQILYVDGDCNKFSLDKEALHSIVERIPKDISVGILSVVGAFRSGKSFLLDFFLRYLRAVQAKGDIIFTPAGVVPEWMSFGGTTLEGSNVPDDPTVSKKGFSHRGGSERNTEGIWLWSEPFIIPNEYVPGGELCLLLMDTQGMFDGQTTQMLTTSIFGLSTLLSSYQIYNIEKRLQEDHLQHLALFSEYSRVVFHGDDSKRMSMRLSLRSISRQIPNLHHSLLELPQGDSVQAAISSFVEAAKEKEEDIKKKRKQEAPFQHLDFLVRDWQNFRDEDDLTQCLEEIDVYRKTYLSDRPAEDLQQTRQHIHDCYQNLNVFLLPHPGKEVSRISYNGSLERIDPNFLKLLGFYIEHVLGKNMFPKLINKEVLYAEDFEAFAVAYGEMFSQVNIFPKALTILDATSEVNNNNAYRHSIEHFKTVMESKINKENGFVKKNDFAQLCEQAKKEALEIFDKRATMGNRSKIEECRHKLEEEIVEETKRYDEENKGRDPMALVADFVVPLFMILVSFILKLFFSFVCGPWSETCRSTSEFFSFVITLIIISVVLSNYNHLLKVGKYFKGIFDTLNTVSIKED